MCGDRMVGVVVGLRIPRAAEAEALPGIGDQDPFLQPRNHALGVLRDISVGVEQSFRQLAEARVANWPDVGEVGREPLFQTRKPLSTRTVDIGHTYEPCVGRIVLGRHESGDAAQSALELDMTRQSLAAPLDVVLRVEQAVTSGGQVGPITRAITERHVAPIAAVARVLPASRRRVTRVRQEFEVLAIAGFRLVDPERLVVDVSSVALATPDRLSLIHISEPTRLLSISYAVF